MKLKREQACLVRLIWINFEMCGKWQYSWYFVGRCFQDLFDIARSILVQLSSSFFSKRFISILVVHPYIRMAMTVAQKKMRFISSDKSDFHMTDSLSVAVHAFASYVLMSLSVDKTLLPRKENLSIGFGGPSFSDLV